MKNNNGKLSMEIKYLTILEQNPTYTYHSIGDTDSLEPIPDSEITALEIKYNNGNPFPVVLKELLSLAGNFCYVLDYGTADSQDELQQDARKYLNDNISKGYQISRPFFAIDVYGGDHFLFVYLDEGVDDPMVYEACPYQNIDYPHVWLYCIQKTLSQNINDGMKRLLSGYNPF